MQNLIKAEMWDKMQYLFRNFYDRMMHCVLFYDGKFEITLLKEALKFQIDNVPILHSRYHNNFIKPYWVTKDYSIDEVLTVKTSKNLDYDVDKFLVQQISIKESIQLQVAVFECDGKSALVFVVNHMTMDGGDFKNFLKTLCKNYTKLTLGDKNLQIKHGSRSFKMIYSNLSDEDKKIAKGLYKNVSQVKDRHRFPLTPPSHEDISRIIKHKLPADKFTAMRTIGKKLGYTVNDVMLACYIRSIYEVGGFASSESVTVPCMVDLRRHLKAGEETGFTNHTGFMNCTVACKGETILDTLAEIKEAMEVNKADKFLGLYSLPLLSLAYLIFPHFFSEFAIKLGYNNPLIGMSNIGVINPADYSFGNLSMYDGFLTGAVKGKPYMQLALTTLNDEVTFTIAIKGNTKDEEIVKKFFRYFDANVNLFINIK